MKIILLTQVTAIIIWGFKSVKSCPAKTSKMAITDVLKVPHRTRCLAAPTFRLASWVPTILKIDLKVIKRRSIFILMSVRFVLLLIKTSRNHKNLAVCLRSVFLIFCFNLMIWVPYLTTIYFRCQTMIKKCCKICWKKKDLKTWR